MNISRDELIDLLDYDKSTGHFYWKPRCGSEKWNSRYANSRAGTVRDSNNWKHRRIVIHKKTYLEHRLAWLYDKGVVPDMIDHINGDATDNRISNLRACTKKQNGANRNRKAKNKSSVFIGVSRHAKTGKWMAGIQTDGKSKTIGLFNTDIEAAIAYNEKGVEIFGEYFGGNKIWMIKKGW